MFHFGRQRFRSKFLACASTNSNGLPFSGTGLSSHAKPNAHADFVPSNKNHREPDSNAYTVTNSDSYAAR
jgi:hypothetical protein